MAQKYSNRENKKKLILNGDMIPLLVWKIKDKKKMELWFWHVFIFNTIESWFHCVKYFLLPKLDGLVREKRRGEEVMEKWKRGIGVNSTGFFSGKFLPWLVFWFVLRVVFGLRCVAGFCGQLRGSLYGWLGVLGWYGGG